VCPSTQAQLRFLILLPLLKRINQVLTLKSNILLHQTLSNLPRGIYNHNSLSSAVLMVSFILAALKISNLLRLLFNLHHIIVTTQLSLCPSLLQVLLTTLSKAAVGMRTCWYRNCNSQRTVEMLEVAARTGETGQRGRKYGI